MYLASAFDVLRLNNTILVFDPTGADIETVTPFCEVPVKLGSGASDTSPVEGLMVKFLHLPLQTSSVIRPVAGSTNLAGYSALELWKSYLH